MSCSKSKTASSPMRVIKPHFKACHWCRGNCCRSEVTFTLTIDDLLHSKGTQCCVSQEMIWNMFERDWLILGLMLLTPHSWQSHDPEPWRQQSLWCAPQWGWLESSCSPPAVWWSPSYWSNNKSFSCSVAFPGLPGRWWRPAKSQREQRCGIFSLDFLLTCSL